MTRDLAKLGAALRTVREQRGISQAQLSRASGLHRTTIAAIERGLRDPRYETLMKLKRGLGSLADVFAEIEGDDVARAEETG